MYRYSLANLLLESVTGQRRRAWKDSTLKRHYDVIIIGAGGHGLATAFYLTKNDPSLSVAVLEKGYLGGGNVGRNTTIVRSNYLLPENIAFYDFSLGLWESLSDTLNFNVMFSARGEIDLATSDDEMHALARRGNAMRFNGVDCELLGLERLKAFVPELDCSAPRRFPIIGGLLQRRAGTARHDAVVWGYARAASALGVDIVQDCEVVGFDIVGDRINSVKTSQGDVAAERIGLAVAGNTSRLADMAGLRLPVETHLLQAFVTEPLKPFLNTVLTYTYNDTEVYISQSDKGGLVFGGGLDGYNSYRQIGAFDRVREVVRGAVSLFPEIGQARLLRHWAGMNDMTMDGSPLIGKTPISNLYLNGGWCYGGFKATPASGYCFAQTIADDEPHPLIAPFSLDRFQSGNVLDELGHGPFPGRH